MVIKFSTKVLITLTVLFISVNYLFAQDPSFVSTQESVTESVKLVPCKSEERLEGVKNLFAKMGAKPEDITIEKFDKDKISNVVVTKKGKTDEKIIIGAHYDKTKEGCGAVDNWTGISIIAHLYSSLKQLETEKTYIFVAFDQEEPGLYGSEAMAKNIPKEDKQQYCSMVNFDSFGFSAPFVLSNTSSGKLADFTKKLAKENNFKMVEVVIEGADADSSSFKSRDIPSVTLSGLDNNWQKILHTNNDKIEKVNMSSVYFGYRFGLILLGNLDEKVCRESKAKLNK